MIRPELFMVVAVSLLLTVPANAEPPTLTETAQRLDEVAAAVPGTLGYCVMTVDGDVLFSRNANESFPQASAIKVPILMELVAQREAGKLASNERIPIDKANQVGGSGVLQQLSDGGSQLSIGDLAVLMIVVSDNTATNIVIDRVGIENVTQRMNSLGCPGTKLRRVMMDTAAAARGEENVSTPNEAARLMQILAKGEFLNRAASDEVLEILRKPKSTAVRKAIPAEISLANKPGGIPGVATEWALVEFKPRPYVITLMGKDGKESEFTRVFTEIAECAHQFINKEE